MFHWLDTPRAAYESAAEWVARYPSLGPGDAIIGASAAYHGSAILTLDKAFLQLREVGLTVDLL